MHGGYKVIDLKGINLSTLDLDGVKFDGLYDTIEGTKKITILENIVINGKELKDQIAVFALEDTAFIAYIDNTKKLQEEAEFKYAIIVTSDDIVTVAGA